VLPERRDRLLHQGDLRLGAGHPLPRAGGHRGHRPSERGVGPGELTLGSDNGTACTSRAFRARLAHHGIVHRRGGYRDPESQAFLESWFGKLKQRCIWREEFETLDEARTVIGGYVDRYHHRPHQGLAQPHATRGGARLEGSRRPVNPSGLTDNTDEVHATRNPRVRRFPATAGVTDDARPRHPRTIASRDLGSSAF
jgi:hypothetical protein